MTKPETKIVKLKYAKNPGKLKVELKELNKTLVVHKILHDL